LSICISVLFVLLRSPHLVGEPRGASPQARASHQCDSVWKRLCAATRGGGRAVHTITAEEEINCRD
jgi:hypothetical protein